MIKRERKLRIKRVFSEDFKKARVKEYELGEFTVKEISDLFSVCSENVYRWIYKYSLYNKKGLKVVEMAKSSEQKVKELQKKIAELERLLGQKQIKIDYLETMIEVAKDEFDIDLKKSQIHHNHSHESKSQKLFI